MAEGYQYSVCVYAGSSGPEGHPEMIEEELNARGHEGYRLVSVTHPDELTTVTVMEKTERLVPGE